VWMTTVTAFVELTISNPPVIEKEGEEGGGGGVSVDTMLVVKEDKVDVPHFTYIKPQCRAGGAEIRLH
jgi:hypothetical protein